ncbi:MAG: 5'-nucleotidase C-terminal domain-containing protein [Armatimonadota bacterium]
MRTISVVLILALAAGLACAAGTTTGQLTSANAQREETSFGDLTADALARVAGTTIALVPAVSFKSGTIPPGPVTAEAVRPLLTQPTESWAVVALTGRELRETLERSVARAPQPHSGFLQVSGVTLTYDPAGPRNARIVSLTASGADVQPDARYEVAMPLSLAKGGSGYFTIFREEDIVRSGSDQLVDVIVSFVEAHGEVSYTGQGRINVAA